MFSKSEYLPGRYMNKGDNKPIDYGNVFRTLLNISDGTSLPR